MTTFDTPFFPQSDEDSVLNSFRNSSEIPNDTRIIVDTNIIIYAIEQVPHENSYQSHLIHESQEIFRRAKEREIKAVIPPAVLNELLHKLMVSEVIEKKITREDEREKNDESYKLKYFTPKDAQNYIKDNPKCIEKLSKAWLVKESLSEIFEFGTDKKQHTEFTYRCAKQFQLMQKDASIVAFAKSHGIVDIATNDRDFLRVKGIQCWSPRKKKYMICNISKYY